jgi:hypothetical protein
MVAHLIEFATNHYILVGIFVVLLAADRSQMQGGGRSLSTGELTTGQQGRRRGGRHPSGKDFAAGHIVGAVNIPQDKLAARMASWKNTRPRPSFWSMPWARPPAPRSRADETGFTAAKLSGGVSSWKADNLPLVK